MALLRSGGHLLLAILLLKELVQYTSFDRGFSAAVAQSAPFETTEQQQNRHVVGTSAKRSICKHVSAIISNKSALNNAIEQMDIFHNRGGGLDTLIQYQDENAKNTFANYNLAIHPEGENATSFKYGREGYEYMQRYMVENNDPRGGYFTKLPGGDYPKNHVQNQHHVHAKDKKVHMEEPVAEERWTAGMGPIGPACDNLYKFGTGYEAKYFCMPPLEEEKQPGIDSVLATAGSATGCHLLSVGSNDQWGFETHAMEHMPHCQTHTFDCTLKDNTPRKKPNNSNVHFYPYCISSHAHTDSFGRQYLTYAEMWDKTGATTAPQFAKIDVEGFEFEIFPQMMKDAAEGRTLLPEQLMVELHFMTRMWAISWNLRSISAAEIMMLVGTMFRQEGGYMPAYTFFERGGCIPCLETLFIRVQC